MLLPVGHLAGHDLLLQLAVDLLIDQDEAAAGGKKEKAVQNKVHTKVEAKITRGEAEKHVSASRQEQPVHRSSPVGSTAATLAERSACPPEHGAAEGPLVCAVLKQHNLKQGGQDLRQQLGPLPQMLPDGLRRWQAQRALQG